MRTLPKEKMYLFSYKNDRTNIIYYFTSTDGKTAESSLVAELYSFQNKADTRIALYYFHVVGTANLTVRSHARHRLLLPLYMDIFRRFGEIDETYFFVEPLYGIFSS